MKKDYKLMKAVSAYEYGLPTLGIYTWYKGLTETNELGDWIILNSREAKLPLMTGNNTILAWSKPAGPNAELLTANNVTPYILAMTDLRNGPVVIEVLAATKKAVLYGQIVDHWKWAIADVGPIGLDKGKGGKYLLLPPDYKGKVPKGYLVLNSPNYRVYLTFRSIKSPDVGINIRNQQPYQRFRRKAR
ncbi:MAG: DUF1254 domain-containing protein [Chlorobi bacterium]|nr:DUF1254 domain-containing protein [Chlorobiota bacterium]